MDSVEDPDELVDALDGSVRRSDSYEWLQGSEYGLLMPCTSGDAASQAAQRITRFLDHKGVKARVSVAMLAGPEESGESRRDAAAPRANPKAREGRKSSVLIEQRGVQALLARPMPRWKRAFDITAASLGLVLLSPLILLIAIAVKVTSRGPVIFRQHRTGRGMVRFTMYKFRTMYEGPSAKAEWELRNEMTGPLFKMERDPRRTPLGRILRKTSLDELPQLWNVLRGEMTFIGPRALSPTPKGYKLWQLRRFDVVPGIACEWQAYHRGRTDFDEWMRSDLRYIDQPTSFRKDMTLLFKTIWAVVRCAGSR